jgi:penicillin-binding protein 1A
MQKNLQNLRLRIQKNIDDVKIRVASSLKILQPGLSRIRKSSEAFVHFFETHPKTRIAVSVAAVPAALLVVLVSIVFYKLPGKQELRQIQNPLASEVYSADSVLLGRYYIQDRIQVKYEDISPAVIQALIPTEDVRFYKHSGVDVVSLGRVIFKSILLQDESSGGGSTITQQLAKNLYPRKEYSAFSMLVNKLRECVIAFRLESIYSKNEIIALYLNTIPFADNTYGLQSAAKRFFSSTAKDLTIEQAAVLVGMLKATHYYNPRLFPKRALERRNVVLAQMAKYDYLDSKVLDSVKKLPINLKYQKVFYNPGLAPYFREYLKSELQAWCEKNKKPDGTPYNLYTDGLKIYTTIDSKLQGYAEKAVLKQMAEVQKQFFDHWGKDKPWKDKEHIVEEAIRRSSRYKHLKEQGLSESEIMKKLSEKIPMRLFSWEGEKDVLASPIDSIKHHLQFLNAGFIAVEPSSGQVKAWVGGIDHDFFQYDHVKASTRRQVGSVFKPIVFATAIEQGISPCELVPAWQETYIDDEGQLWTPKNTQYDYQVQYSMRGALAYSVNTVSVKLIQRAGVENTIAMARKMGIDSEIPDVPSIALGSSSLSLIEMTAAYTCLANEGISRVPHFITTIQDRTGNVYDNFKHKVSGTRAVSKETSQMVRQMLQTVVHEGTASRLRWKYGIYNDVAAKTGTTQANADGWFMAMTPNLVMGAWVGADDPRIRFRHTSLGQGSNTALPITAYFLKQVNEDAAYRNISKAKFPPLPNSLQRKLNCDLYELDQGLWAQIEQTIHQRDSIIQADTVALPPPETFLQTLYKRKKKILLASQPKEEVELVNEAGGGATAIRN